MSFRIIMRALGVTTLSLSLTPAFAQDAARQMPGMTQGAGGNAAACAQNSQGVTKALDAVNGRIEDARQSNDPGKLRAAVSDLQVALAQIKMQLADCVALGADAGGGAMGNMPGTDHSTMQMAPSAPVAPPRSAAPAPAAKGAMPGMDHSKMADLPPAKPRPAAAAAPKQAEMNHSKMAMEKAAPVVAAAPAKVATPSGVVVALRTQPAPPRSGSNNFEVTVKDATGKPIADAEVSLAFYMAPMPSMKMPAMRSTATLTSAGNGSYKGSAAIGMAGDWDVTVTASRKGEPLVSKTMKLTVK